MCRIGGAQIVGSKSNPSQQSANWYVVSHSPSSGTNVLTWLVSNDIARTAGIVFDNCWRSDDTIVGSEICITNNQMQVNVLGL